MPVSASCFVAVRMAAFLSPGCPGPTAVFMKIRQMWTMFMQIYAARSACPLQIQRNKVVKL